MSLILKAGFQMGINNVRVPVARLARVIGGKQLPFLWGVSGAVAAEAQGKYRITYNLSEEAERDRGGRQRLYAPLKELGIDTLDLPGNISARQFRRVIRAAEGGFLKKRVPFFQPFYYGGMVMGTYGKTLFVADSLDSLASIAAEIHGANLTFDYITKLPNSRNFLSFLFDKLAESRQNPGVVLTLVQIDFDENSVFRGLSTDQRDQVLRLFGNVLCGVFKREGSGYVFRLDGNKNKNKFAVLLTGHYYDPEIAGAKLKKIYDEETHGGGFTKVPWRVVFNAGIARYHRETQEDSFQFLQRVAQLVAEAKSASLLAPGVLFMFEKTTQEAVTQ